MTRYHKALGVFLVTLFGLWGCARGPATSNSTNDRIKALEAKTAKLEEDLKAALTLNNELRKKLSDSEEAQAQLQSGIKERDTMIKTRTTERDTVQAQYEIFRKSLKDLIGQAEAALPNVKPATTGVATSTQPAGPQLSGGGGS